MRHRWWGTIGLPIWSWLYVRQKDIAELAEQYGWMFQTKLEQAADLVLSAVETLQSVGKEVWVVADGAYTKRPFIRPVMELGVTLVGRLRKDAALFDLPAREKTVRRGPKRIYGKTGISLIKRAAHPCGWQEVACRVYGREEVKQVKTFLATHRTFGGTIRVVIVKENTGPQFFYCTDLDADTAQIIETFADRSAIEQVFHDVKEVWGSGQQQTRNLWSNIAVWHLNLWMYTLVELYCWDRPGANLVHREDSPWDDPQRRPSHADRRKALQAESLSQELNCAELPRPIREKFRKVLHRLFRMAI